MLNDVLNTIDTSLGDSLERLFGLLRIPSVSTDPAFGLDCKRAAQWLADQLTGMGFEATVRPTGGQPMVVAHWQSDGSAPDAPHVLFYGHYDVQPADPAELWHTPAFKPALFDSPTGRKQIHGRGAADDKGQLMTFVEACRAWIKQTGDLPIRVSIMLEGEEETGSPNLAGFLDAHAEELKADVVLVCDTGMWDEDTPAVTTMLRGLMGQEVEITGPKRDLHSGLYGGAARNPIHVLARIIADLHDADGRIQIPGFYDGVKEMPEDIKAQWAALNETKPEFLQDVGLSLPSGEKDRSLLEQVWARPTCDINGIWGGYTGEGSKTIVPSKASAKFSFRLVGDQDPEAIRDAFQAFVKERLPADCSVDFKRNAGSPALAIDLDNPYLGKALTALTEEFGRDAAMIGCGGSIPVVGDFKRKLGMDSLLIGFGLDNDQIHSPNEKYDLASFHKGIRSWARILDALRP